MDEVSWSVFYDILPHSFWVICILRFAFTAPRKTYLRDSFSVIKHLKKIFRDLLELEVNVYRCVI